MKPKRTFGCTPLDEPEDVSSKRLKSVGKSYSAIADKNGAACTSLRGYTLVEILIGVFIMSVGMVSILGVFPIGVMIVQKIKVTTVLCNFAVMKVAEFQAYYSPMETLSFGEDHWGQRNRFVEVTADRIHSVPGLERDSGFRVRGPNGSPRPDQLKIWGAGRNLHWKISDYERYEFEGLYDHQIAYEGWGRPRDYGDHSLRYTGRLASLVFNRDYRMGMVQNQRRPYNGYGFCRKYVIEVWEGGENTKTDRAFNPSTDELKAYYAYITGIWNPHMTHGTEWSPVMQSTRFADRDYAYQTLDYFWPWNNPHPLEGWGHRSRGGETGGGDYPVCRPSTPASNTPGGGDYPWG